VSIWTSPEQVSSRTWKVKVYGLRYPLSVEDARDLADALYLAADKAEVETNIARAEAEEAQVNA
jgi:hypothetical protein